MIRVESPAKLNLALLVEPPRGDGYHPLDSLVQTIEWCDVVALERSEDEEVIVEGADLDPSLVAAALAAVREVTRIPRLTVTLTKTLPVAAGLGGGSSNAAATILGALSFSPGAEVDLVSIGAGVGADVPLFFTGGTLRMTGIGEIIEPLPPLSGFAVAVVVPGFGLTTADVYRNWDRMEGPSGSPLPEASLPPVLRDGIPLRNDLLPAAIDLEPRLGDFMADVRAVWGVPIALSGSGSACFGYFPTLEEAHDAASSVSHLCQVARGVALRESGVQVI